MSLPTRIIDLPQYGNDVFIRARVIYKSNLITCKNGVKQLKLHFMDSSDTISAVAYGEEATAFYEIFQFNKVYELFNFYINAANKLYNKLKNNYELTLNNLTTILPYENEVVNVPAIQYNFLTIAEIFKLSEATMVDCIAVCRKVDYLQGGISTFKKDYQKRNLQLVDNSNAVIELTLWNDDACNFNEQAPFIIAVRKAIIKVYNKKKSLNMSIGSSLEINPSFCLAEIDNLKKCLNFEWRDSLFGRKNFSPTGYFQTKGVIHCIDCKNLYYEACKRCFKKVFKSSDGVYRCEKCKFQSTDYKYRLMLKMFIGEPFTDLEVICFNEFIENFIGRSAEEVVAALEQDPTNAEEIFKPIYYKTFIFNLHVTNKTYEGNMQPNVEVISAMPINNREYNEHLIDNLKKLIQIKE